MSSNNKSSSSTQETFSTAHDVSAARTHVSVVWSLNSDNISDAAICAFLADLTTISQVMHQDLEQFDPNNLE